MNNGTEAARILLVEDEVLIALAEMQSFRRAGYEVEHALDGESAVVMALEKRFDLILMDIDLGSGIDGGEAARRIRALGGPPVVFLSSRTEDAALAKTRDSGGYGYIVKGSGDRIVLASVRMALGLARALRELADSEGRWASLVRTAPDYIVSIGRDRRIRSINRPPANLRVEQLIGHDFIERIVPRDKGLVARKIEGLFIDGQPIRALFRVLFSSGIGAEYEAYLGPVFEEGKVASATAVLRDVSGVGIFSRASELSDAERREELEMAIASLDFASIQDYLLAFQRLTGAQAAILSRGGWEILASSKRARACNDFANRGEGTRKACIESNVELERGLSEAGAEGFAEHRCAHGLRDLALPLLVDGMHWGSLYLGQFLYDDDELDEAAAAERARMGGWGEADYLAALREIPRFSREEVSDFRIALAAFGKVVSELALSAYKARILERYGAAAESARDEIDRLYRLVSQNLVDVIWVLDPQGTRFTFMSPSVESLRGLSVEEAMGESLEDSLSPESLALARELLGELARQVAAGEAAARKIRTALFRQRCKDGSLKWLEVTMKPAFDESGKLVEIVGVSRDADERVRFESSIESALADKDRIYAELQHRVKNSLALISSLLSLSAGNLEDESARDCLGEAQARVRSIGLLYEQLYRTRSVEDIELGGYLSAVAKAALEAPSARGSLRFEASCDGFRIDTDRAVSAGLLLYEMASNAAKHAFADRDRGTIRLELRLEGSPEGASSGGFVLLRLEDDGAGLPEGFDIEAQTGLGSVLIRQLAAQLGGRVAVGKGIGGRGAGFLVRFPLDRD